MSEIADLLHESLTRLLEQHCDPEIVRAWEEGAEPGDLWSALIAAGLPQLLAAEETGADMADATVVARLCGRHFAPVPLVETILANRLLAAAGLPPGEGALSLAWSDGRVAWGQTVGQVLVLLPGDEAVGLARLDATGLTPQPANLAGEPQGLLPSSSKLQPEALLPADLTLDQVRAWAALLRAAQLVGAMERVLDMALAHVRERQQFGRPLNRFQAVQHAMVRAAEETAAAGIAVDAAAAAASGGPDGWFESAIAKARASEAAGIVAATVHQLHGAIGFTRDLPLNLGTRRLWAWREEYGNEAYWQERLGRAVAERGGDALWSLLTRQA